MRQVEGVEAQLVSQRRTNFLLVLVTPRPPSADNDDDDDNDEDGGDGGGGGGGDDDNDSDEDDSKNSGERHRHLRHDKLTRWRGWDRHLAPPSSPARRCLAVRMRAFSARCSCCLSAMALMIFFFSQFLLGMISKYAGLAATFSQICAAKWRRESSQRQTVNRWW